MRVLRALRAGPSGLGVLSLVLGERPNVVASRMARLAGREFVHTHGPGWALTDLGRAQVPRR